MSGFNLEVAMHSLAIHTGSETIKQAHRFFYLDFMQKISAKVQKLKDVDFTREEMHPEWLVNTVPMTRMNGQIHACIDLGDLIDLCIKDDFPLPMNEIMIDNTFDCAYVFYE